MDFLQCSCHMGFVSKQLQGFEDHLMGILALLRPLMLL